MSAAGGNFVATDIGLGENNVRNRLVVDPVAVGTTTASEEQLQPDIVGAEHRNISS